MVSFFVLPSVIIRYILGRMLEVSHDRSKNYEKFPYRVSIREPLSRAHVQETTHVTVRDEMCGAINSFESNSESTLMYGYWTAVSLKCKLRRYKGSDFSHTNANISN
jgi:hypothetical protein